MIINVYLKKLTKKMTHSDSTVLIGGLMHVPFIIAFLRIIENRLKKYEFDLKQIDKSF